MRGMTFRYLDRDAIIHCGGLDISAALHDVEEALRLQERGCTTMPLEVPLLAPAEPDAALGSVVAPVLLLPHAAMGSAKASISRRDARRLIPTAA